MRSRYSAYVVGDVTHLLRSWHPRTRPAELELDPELTWTGLTIIDHGVDWVEFEAAHRRRDSTGVLHERSRFERRGGRWLYLDGDVS